MTTDVELWGTAGFAADPFGPPKRSIRILPGVIARLKPGLDLRQAQTRLHGCVNVANLVLARAAGRQGEVAIRQAVGAAPGRLVRQLLTESLLLSVVAGIVGVLMESWTSGLFLSLAPSKIPSLNEVALDLRVVLFALMISLTGVLFGLAPAVQFSKFSLVDRLRESNPENVLVME